MDYNHHKHINAYKLEELNLKGEYSRQWNFRSTNFLKVNLHKIRFSSPANIMDHPDDFQVIELYITTFLKSSPECSNDQRKISLANWSGKIKQENKLISKQGTKCMSWLSMLN